MNNFEKALKDITEALETNDSVARVKISITLTKSNKAQKSGNESGKESK